MAHESTLTWNTQDIQVPDYNWASQDIFSPASDRMQTLSQRYCKGLYSGVILALSNPLERKIRKGSCAFRQRSLEKSLSCRLILVWCSTPLRVSWLEGRELGFPGRGSAGCPSAQSITSTGGPSSTEQLAWAFGKKSTRSQRRRLRGSGSEHSQHLLQITLHAVRSTCFLH